MEELNEKKTKYFVIAIIILIILGVLLIVHFNNKQMVKGEDEKSDTPTTTEKVTTTTTKKRITEEVKVDEVVYKSVVDNDNKLVYNYKLTEEITDTDVIISKKLEISEDLKEKNVIELFDISLFDANLVKKNVSNSLITIKIPLTEELKAYENYKVIYINENNEITDEIFEVKVDTDYLEFNTTHLSLFGIIGTKKVVEEEKEIVDLSKVTVDIKVDGEVVKNVNNILLTKEEKVELVVNNNNEDCNIEYGLRPTGNDTETNALDYKKYEGTLELVDGINYSLVVKVTYGENNKIFELGKIGLYDVVFKYNKNVQLEGEVVIGELKDNKEDNLDIVIDNITETVEETGNDISTTNNAESNVVNTDGTAVVNVNGNIYLVEETDISKLKMTGYLYIDTNENIEFAKNGNSIDLDGLYSLTIRSKEFMLNGDKYSYEYIDGDLVIYLVEEDNAEVEQNSTEVNTEEGTNESSNEETNNTPANKDENIVYNSKEGNVELNNKFNQLFAGNYGVIIDENNKNDLVIGIINDSNQTTDGLLTEEQNNNEPTNGEPIEDSESNSSSENNPK